MRLANSFEQGVCIMAILATQTDDVPVSSRTLQSKLNSSMTYSQKILRKLVVSGLIKSVPGNSGGFMLAQDIKQISVLNVVEALEGTVDSFPATGLFDRVFSGTSQHDKAITATADSVVHRIFATADGVWKQVLSQITLDEIIERVSAVGRPLTQIDWNNQTVNIDNKSNSKREDSND